MREPVIDRFPKEPGMPRNIEAYMKSASVRVLYADRDRDFINSRDARVASKRRKARKSGLRGFNRHSGHHFNGH